MKVRHLGLVILCLVILVACGGGGGGGDGGGATTSSTNPVANAVATTDLAELHYSSVVSGSTGTGTLSPREALIDTASWLTTQDSVKSATISTNQDILYVEYKDGAMIIMDATDSGSTSTLSLKAECINQTTETIQVAAVTSSLNALILEPINSEISFTAPEDITTILRNNNFSVNYLADSDVTPDVFTTFSDYDFILFNGHGSYDSSLGWHLLSTGEEYSDAKAKEYYRKFGYFKIIEGVSAGWYWTIFYKLNLKKKHFAVTSDFISDYSKSLKATAILLNSCHSLDAQSPLASVFMKNGAKAVIGWTNDVNIDDIDKNINIDMIV